MATKRELIGIGDMNMVNVGDYTLFRLLTLYAYYTFGVCGFDAFTFHELFLAIQLNSIQFSSTIL